MRCLLQLYVARSDRHNATVQLVMQEYTDDTAELRRQLDALGGMAALQEPERQMQAIMELEQFVSAVMAHILIY